MIKIFLASLGCDKNRIDSENLLAKLSKLGCEFAPQEQADAIIVNTCAFIDSAKEEAIDTVLSAIDEKKRRGAAVIVTGCLPERYRESLVEEFPEVDAFLGINDYASIAAVVQNAVDGKKTVSFSESSIPLTERILTTPPHYAYLRIADGCNNSCTFCAIPKIRGKYRSRTIESLVEETESLCKNYGVRELILVAQDTTRYGTDLYGKPSLVELLSELEKTDVEKIRILYMYPEAVSDELISYIVGSKKVLRYADVPLQHISDDVLRRMARRSREAEIRALLQRLHREGFTVRSTFISGFPGETEEDFQKLLRFIEDGNLEFAGFFEYCAEDGTSAAALPQISAEVKRARREKLEEAQAEVMAKNNDKLVGSVLSVVYEDVDYDGGCFVGRAGFQAPDIDTRVFFLSDFPVNAGDSYDVEITGSVETDLYGKTVPKNI